VTAYKPSKMLGNNHYVGIDPGKSGAIVTISETLDVVEVLPKMPWINDRLDSNALFEFLAKAKEGCDKLFVVCEKVHSMPRDSSRAAFTFGGSYFGCLCVIDLFDIPLLLVAPQTWKKVMLRDRGKEKADSINAGRDLFPALRPQLTTKSSHGVAEAALIAAYGIKSWKGKDNGRHE